MQSLTFGVPMPSTLPSSPPPSTWTWIASLNIINTFHLGLSRPHSYHHIPYALYIEVQRVLHIPLAWLVSNLAYIFAIPFLVFVIFAMGW
jgi:hypothetical protein